MSDGYIQLGFGTNDGGVSSGKNRLVLTKNETARVSMLWWPGLESGNPDLSAASPGFAAAKRHYLPGVGYFIHTSPEHSVLAGGAPKMRVVTLVVRWPLTRSGKLDNEAIAADDGVEVLYFIMDPKKYDTLKSLHSKTPFNTTDISIMCTKEQFQEFTFLPEPDQNTLSKVLKAGKDNKLVRSILDRGQAMLADVNDQLGRIISPQDIREKLAGGGGGPSNNAGVTADVDEALSSFLD